MLSLLCPRIHGYMLALINEVDPCVAFIVGFVWDAKPIFPTDGSHSLTRSAFNLKVMEEPKRFMRY